MTCAFVRQFHVYWRCLFCLLDINANVNFSLFSSVYRSILHLFGIYEDRIHNNFLPLT